MSDLDQFFGGGEVGDFKDMPDVGALVVKNNGSHWLRTGSVALASSYPLAAAVDFLKCTGSASNQAFPLGSIYTDIGTNGAGKWVIAYGDATNVLVSTDNGANFSQVAHNAGGQITSVCWNATNGLFVCAGNTSSTILSSTQTAASVASAWTVRTVTTVSGATANTAIVRASSAEVLIMVGNIATSGVARSTNGTTWTAKNFGDSPYSSIGPSALVYLGSGIWIAAGSGAFVQRSTDGGLTWAGMVNQWPTVGMCAFGAGICVGFDIKGNLYTTTTGESGTVTNRGNPFANWNMRYVMHDGTRFIGVLEAKNNTIPYKNAYAYSADGLNWYMRGFLNKSWPDSCQSKVWSDGTNLLFVPHLTSSQTGAVYGTFADNTYVGIPYVCSSSSSTNAFLPDIKYVRVKP